MRKTIFLLVALGLGSSALGGTLRSEWIGKPIEALNLPKQTTPSVYLFLQPDCSACSLQLATLASLQKKNPSLKIVIVAEKKSSELNSFLEGFNLKYTLHYDPSGESVQTLSIKTIPATIFVDQYRRVEALYEGSLVTSELNELTSALVSGKQLPKFIVPGEVGSSATPLPGVRWETYDNHLLIFHSSTCKYCVEEIPYVLDFSRRNPKVAIWIIAMDDSASAKKQFSGAPNNISLITESSNSGSISKLVQSYKVQGTPTQILVDRKGLIKWRDSGFHAEGRNPFVAGKLPLN